MRINKLVSRVLSLSVVLLPFAAISQTNKQAATVHTDTISTSDGMHSLFASIGYGSNMIYLGSTISQDQPYGYGAITYGYGSKLYLTASAVHLADRSPFAAFFTGTVSFSHTFNSWLDISAGVSRYQVTPSLADTLFNSFIYSDITLGFDWRILYTRISAGGLLSDGADAYFQFKNSRYFQTPEFTSKKFYFSFDPYFNILAGSMTKAETTSGTTITLSPPYRKKGKNGQSPSSISYTTVFGIMEVDCGIPVAFNAGRFTVEAEPFYILPVYEDPEYPGLKGFNILISLYLRIF